MKKDRISNVIEDILSDEDIEPGMRQVFADLKDKAEKNDAVSVAKIMDENNKEPIELYDRYLNSCLFEQIAVIPYNGEIYAILKPLEELDGVGEDEAIVFHVCFGDDDEDESYKDSFLEIEQDEDTAEAVFNIYLKMLEEE